MYEQIGRAEVVEGEIWDCEDANKMLMEFIDAIDEVKRRT
jgi:hypothetical protein